MAILSRITNTYFALKFVRVLTKKWKDMEAYKLGIIDDNGNKIRNPETSEEKAAYSYFDRLVFNLKKLLGKIPGGKSGLASYSAAALLLLKEKKYDLGKNTEKVISILEDKYVMKKITTDDYKYLDEEGSAVSTGNVVTTPGKKQILGRKKKKKKDDEEETIMKRKALETVRTAIHKLNINESVYSIPSDLFNKIAGQAIDIIIDNNKDTGDEEDVNIDLEAATSAAIGINKDTLNKYVDLDNDSEMAKLNLRIDAYIEDFFRDEIEEGVILKKVVRQGKIKKIKKCNKENERLVNGKCVQKDAKFKKSQKKSIKKRKITMKGKSLAKALKKRERSLRKVK